MKERKQLRQRETATKREMERGSLKEGEPREGETSGSRGIRLTDYSHRPDLQHVERDREFRETQGLERQ